MLTGAIIAGIFASVITLVVTDIVLNARTPNGKPGSKTVNGIFFPFLTFMWFLLFLTSSTDYLCIIRLNFTTFSFPAPGTRLHSFLLLSCKQKQAWLPSSILGVRTSHCIRIYIVLSPAVEWIIKISGKVDYKNQWK